MQNGKTQQPDELVRERIIAELNKNSVLGVKHLEKLREYFSNGVLSRSDAESLFEFDRPEGVAK